MYGGNKVGTIDQQFEVNQCRNKDNIMVNSITFMQAYKDKVFIFFQSSVYNYFLIFIRA
jgi:hypothetical protein